MSAYERVKFWHDSTLSNLELLHATYVTHTFAPHIHEGYAIGIIEQGAEQFHYQRGRHVAPAGSIVIINPGEMHTGSAASVDGWTYRMLYPSIELLQRAASEMTDRQHGTPFFAEPVVNNPELRAEIFLAHRAIAEGASALERESRLLWTLARLVLRYSDDQPHLRSLTKEHLGIQRIRSYLDEHYAENITLGQLAEIAHLSSFHLLRSFKDQVKLPPHAYQLQVRIKRARQMLQLGVPCVETALAVGFADQSHFTKHFKRVTGVTPGVYSAEFARKSNF